MRKSFTLIFCLLTFGMVSFGQAQDPAVSNCLMNAGANTKYLKDFRIQLGRSEGMNELRFRARMSLWKNTKYRFTLCSSPESKGRLIISLIDDRNKVVVSSYDGKSGKADPFVDFQCSKSGVYQLCYDFAEGEQGSGVGVVSMLQ
jgi:hypothetical protein